jgi:1,6-anhydro-N-acetylmuramate kinase
MTQEKILEKLGKIKAHMESAQEIGNEAEAQAFASMLQNLLTKHKLEMTDITPRGRTCRRVWHRQ